MLLLGLGIGFVVGVVVTAVGVFAYGFWITKDQPNGKEI